MFEPQLAKYTEELNIYWRAQYILKS